MKLRSKTRYAPLRMHGQEYVATTWAMANMNMIIHDMEGAIEIGDTFKNPKFRESGHLQTFDRVVSNPMWNQDWFKEDDYDADELGRFPQVAGFPRSRPPHELLHFHAPNHGKLWKSLMRAHLGECEHLESELHRMTRDQTA